MQNFGAGVEDGGDQKLIVALSECYSTNTSALGLAKITSLEIPKEM